MKKIAILFLFCCSYSFNISAQNISYSPLHNNEGVRDVSFEILGKVGANYLIFKNIGWRSILQVLDEKMNEKSNERLKFMPDKVLNVDFITYPDHFFMIYQYSRQNVLYSDVAKFDGNGKKLLGPITIDTTRMGLRNPNGVYNLVYSEDKKKVLLYKMIERDGKLNLMTKLFDENFRLLDSTRSLFNYNDRKEVYSPFQVANDGNFFFLREKKAGRRENINEVEVFDRKPNAADFVITPINMQKVYVDEASIKIDNLNNNFIVNSLYYPERKTSSIAGLFTAVINRDDYLVHTYINPFNDSLRSIMAQNSQFRFAFDNLFLKNIYVKKDGSFLLIAEDFSSQNLGGGFGPWNRWDYLYANPYSMYDYGYMYSPYYRYNRYNSFNTMRTTRFYYDKILVLNIDKNLKLDWSNVILKEQVADDDDSYLSFGSMNAGAEINFLFIERNKNAQIVNNHSITSYGNQIRYPTIKSREAGYQFMPRMLKQVAAKSIIMPAVLRGNIVFAKMDFQ